MTTLQTNADIIEDILFRANEPTDGTSDFHDRAVAALNRAYREIWQGGQAFDPSVNEPWLWLKKDPPGVMTINPVVSGSATVTNNSTAVTLGAAPSISLANRFIRFQGNADVFRVAAHTALSTSLTLDSVYTGTSGSVSFDAMQLEYDLASDVLQIIAPMRVYGQNKIEIDGVDLMSLERDYPLNFVQSGTPERFALVTEGKVRFNRYGGTSSTELYRVEYDYLQQPSAELADDSSECLVPLRYRSVLADMALSYLLIDKSDARASDIASLAKAGLSAMASDNRAKLAQMSRNMGRIFARPTRTYRFDRVLRTSSGFIIG